MRRRQSGLRHPGAGAVGFGAGDFQQVARFGIARQRHPETRGGVGRDAVVRAQARVVVRRHGVGRQSDGQHRADAAVQGKVDGAGRNAGIARHIAGDGTQVVDAVCQVHQVVIEGAACADDGRADGRGLVEAAQRHGGLTRVLHAVVVQVVEDVQTAARFTGAAESDVVVLFGDSGVAIDVLHVGIGDPKGGHGWRAGVDGEDQIGRGGVERAFVAGGIDGFGANAVLAIGQCGGVTGAERETAIGRKSAAQQALSAKRVAPCGVVFGIQVDLNSIGRQGARDADGAVFAGDVVGVGGAPVIACGQVQRGHGGGGGGVDRQQIDRRHANRRRTGARWRVTVVIGGLACTQASGGGQRKTIVQIRLRQRDRGFEVGAGGVVGVVNFDFSAHCGIAAQPNFERGVAQLGQGVDIRESGVGRCVQHHGAHRRQGADRGIDHTEPLRNRRGAGVACTVDQHGLQAIKAVGGGGCGRQLQTWAHTQHGKACGNVLRRQALAVHEDGQAHAVQAQLIADHRIGGQRDFEKWTNCIGETIVIHRDAVVL